MTSQLADAPASALVPFPSLHCTASPRRKPGQRTKKSVRISDFHRFSPIFRRLFQTFEEVRPFKLKLQAQPDVLSCRSCIRGSGR